MVSSTSPPLTLGTWQDSDAPAVDKSKFSPSNISLLSRAVVQVTTGTIPGIQPGTEQIVYYQQGVGTSSSLLERLRGGAFGDGLMENVREAYGFIVHNWTEGDEIYLFGFSRGAYTARSVAGLISRFGLLTKRGMDKFGDVIAAYEDPDLDQHPERLQNIDGAERQLPNPRITFIGVWDTVGILGIPDAYFLGFKLQGLSWLIGQSNKKYQFHDTTLHPNVDFAYQAYNLLESG
jgi:uncharacterized protein (DUF2235 family)